MILMKDGSAIGGHNASQTFEESGFSGAIGADEAQDLSLADCKRHVSQRLNGPETLRKVFNPQHGIQ